jgi:hypothetical protein
MGVYCSLMGNTEIIGMSIPIAQTFPAILILAPRTGHMVASSTFLNIYLAFWAFFCVII